MGTPPTDGGRDEKSVRVGGIGLREWTIITGGVSQIGCLTVLVILVALFLGLWLDRQFDTRPWFTLGCILGSIPLSLAALVQVALSTARRVQSPPQSKEESGKDSV